MDDPYYLNIRPGELVFISVPTVNAAATTHIGMVKDRATYRDADGSYLCSYIVEMMDKTLQVPDHWCRRFE